MSELSISTEIISSPVKTRDRSQPTHWVAIAIGVCLICLMRQTVFAVTVQSQLV